MTTIKNAIHKVWKRARKPILYGLAALTITGSPIPETVRAESIVIENTAKSDSETSFSQYRTRIKASSDLGNFTYDFNNMDSPDEAKLWINCLDKNNWKIGVLAQGSNNKTESYADIGALVSKTIGNKTFEAFVGPTIQQNVKPAMFYQAALRNTNNKGNLVLALVDDREVLFKADEMDLRGYFSFQKGNWFAGAGTRQKGLDTTRVYGAGGLKNKNLGSFTYFNYDDENKKLEFTSKNALGNPGSLFQISNVNLWNDMKGPGMRDVSIPYFTSFLNNGDVTGMVKGTIAPDTKDYEIMVGKDFGIVKFGAGINYNKENEKTQYSGLIHALKSFNLGKLGELCIEGKYNSREDQSSIFTRFSKSF